MERQEVKKIPIKQFAELVGVTYAAVFAAIKSGRMDRSVTQNTAGNYLIDPNLGVIEFNERRLKSVRNKGREAQELTPAPEGSVIDSEKKLKHFQAELARVKFEQQSGRLLDAEKVKREAFKVARVVREGVLGIPARISAELAGLTDPFEIENLLERELRTALENLSKEIEIEVDDEEGFE